MYAFCVYLYYYKYSMAKRRASKSRVEYWADYRESIANDFAVEQNMRESRKKEAAKKPFKKEEAPPLTKAEALLSEYERKNENNERGQKKGPQSLVYGLAIIVLLLIILGIIFIIMLYAK